MGKIVINIDEEFTVWWNTLGGIKDNEQMRLVAWWAYCEGKKQRNEDEIDRLRSRN